MFFLVLINARSCVGGREKRKARWRRGFGVGVSAPVLWWVVVDGIKDHTGVGF